MVAVDKNLQELWVSIVARYGAAMAEEAAQKSLSSANINVRVN